MASWYQDYGIYGVSGGSDVSGDGSSGNPWQTLAKVKATANGGLGPLTGDTVYRSGVGTEIISLTSLVGVTIRDWTGFGLDKDGSVINTATPVTSAWSLHSGTTYKANIGAGLTIGNVGERLASRVDAEGRHYGWLDKGSDPGGGALAAAGQWYYNSGTGDLFARLIDGINPSTLTNEDRVQYLVDSSSPTLNLQNSWLVSVYGAGTAGVSVGSGSVQWGQIRNAYCSNSATRYCLALSGTDSTVQDLRLEGGENHAVLVGSGVTQGCVLRNVDSWGCGRTQSASNFVSYSNAANVYTVYDRCIARCFTMLDSTGAPLLRSRDWSTTITKPYDQVGFFAHSDGFQIVDLLWDRCKVYGYGSTLATHSNTTPFDAGDTADPADIRVWSTYAARGNKCRAYRCSRLIQSGSIAHRGGFFDFTKAPLDTVDSIIGYLNNNRTTLFESSVLVFGTDRGSSSRAAFTLKPGARLLLHHCTIILVGTLNWYHDVFDVQSTAAFGTNAGFYVEGLSTVFAFSQADGAVFNENRLFVNDSGAPTSNYSFDRCVYWRIKDTSYSMDASRNTSAEWTNPSTGIDKNGLVVDPGLVSVASVDEFVAGKLSPSSALRQAANKYLRVLGAGRPSDGGYGGTAYDGTRGAWQASSSSGRRVGIRMGIGV